jgi:hypothetical protein
LIVLALGIGMILGFLLKWQLTRKFKDYSGTIVVNRDKLSERTVYSLELDEYPEKLEFKKIVVFRVDASGKSLDRD